MSYHKLFQVNIYTHIYTYINHIRLINSDRRVKLYSNYSLNNTLFNQLKICKKMIKVQPKKSKKVNRSPIKKIKRITGINIKTSEAWG